MKRFCDVVSAHVAIWAGIVIALTFFSGCSEDDPPPTGNGGSPQIVIPGENEPILYSKHIQPIFTKSCAGIGCHIDGNIWGGLTLDSWNTVIKGSNFGAVVIPFAPERSHLFQHINDDTTRGPSATPRMPLGRDALPEEYIETIARWIREGAKNDEGEVPLAGENRPRVFVTAQSEDVVTAIDLETELIMRFIEAGERPNATTAPEAPHNIVLSPDGKYFYVNLIAGGSVEKYNARTFEKLGTVKVGLSPAQIVVTDDGSMLYVSNFDLTFQQRFVNRINAETMSGNEVIEVAGYAPHGVTLSRDEKFLYTMNAGSDDISKIDLATLDVVERIPVVPGAAPAAAGAAEHEPYQSVITEDDIMFMTCRKSGQVRVIDLVAGVVIDSIEVGERPLIPALSPDGSELWVPNQGSNTVSVIDVATRTVIATIGQLNVQPHAVAFTSDGQRVFVTCENQAGDAELHHPLLGTEVIPGFVYVINRATRDITREIEVGGFAAGIVIND